MTSQTDTEIWLVQDEWPHQQAPADAVVLAGLCVPVLRRWQRARPLSEDPALLHPECTYFWSMVMMSQIASNQLWGLTGPFDWFDTYVGHLWEGGVWTPLHGLRQRIGSDKEEEAGLPGYAAEDDGRGREQDDTPRHPGGSGHFYVRGNRFIQSQWTTWRFLVWMYSRENIIARQLGKYGAKNKLVYS